MQHRITVGAILGCLLLTADPLSAQKNPAPETSVSARSVRGGVGLVMGSGGLGAAFDLSMDTRARLYRLRLSMQDRGVMNMGGTADLSNVAETALMLGRGRRFSRNYGSVAAGLSLISVERGSQGEDASTTIGVPVEAQLISGGPLKLGATLAGNLNLEQSFAAFILSIQLGRVPDR